MLNRQLDDVVNRLGKQRSQVVANESTGAQVLEGVLNGLVRQEPEPEDTATSHLGVFDDFKLNNDLGRIVLSDVTKLRPHWPAIGILLYGYSFVLPCWT
jgi:hypothetical protein